MGERLRFVTAALLEIVQLQPCLGEAEGVLGVGEVIDYLFPHALEGAADVLHTCVESLLLGEPSEL